LVFVAGSRFQKKRETFMNIYVGNLSFKTTEEELQKEFEAFGEVESVKIIKDQYSGRSRGFAFVEMQDRNHAMEAISGLNGKEFAGQTLTVNEAKPREARGGQKRGGGGGGGYGNRGGGGGFHSGGRSGGGRPPR
jgi:cold-inducible RNA-binding protein